MTTGGDLLATSSGASNDKLIAAIVVNIWSAYSKFGDKTDLGFLLLDCEVNWLELLKVFFSMLFLLVLLF